ncbi:MAG: hypothetical protein FWF49_02365 [Oscillospiraceae bacterium]|nr:hypothetical protein [Oscillospiraceae bacterium]
MPPAPSPDMRVSAAASSVQSPRASTLAALLKQRWPLLLLTAAAVLVLRVLARFFVYALPWLVDWLTTDEQLRKAFLNVRLGAVWVPLVLSAALGAALALLLWRLRRRRWWVRTAVGAPLCLLGGFVLFVFTQVNGVMILSVLHIMINFLLHDGLKAVGL